ncbi:acyl carrier protein [Bacillus lacus]|uniref:Acyl carrier protein n=2 Tax=Metabacillus lacus TaxID=1983721 RepID=A0A7X2J0M0_9BACI|nr:acyl carrier protein [Metabacillus lacus]
MKEELELNTLENYSVDSRLNEDLYIDSVMLLELILALELQYGFSIPDDRLHPENFKTVGSLILFLESLKVHEGDM